MNEYIKLFTKNAIDKIYKMRNKYIGKYLAIYNENSHLKKSMVTLSSKMNTYEDIVNLRNYFTKKLNNVKYKNKKYELGYFSAIEVDSSNNNEDIYFRNWHVHIQLFTNIPNKKIQEILNKIPTDMCQKPNLTASKNKNAKYNYVIKGLNNIDWELQYYMKQNYPKRSLYSMSRKSVTDYVYKTISKHLTFTLKKEWISIKDKYGTILKWIETKDIIFEDKNITDEGLTYMIDNYSKYNSIVVKDKHIVISKNISSKS